MAKPKKLDPIAPGEILAEEFMKPHRISQNRLARDIDVSPARINDIVHGRSAITASIALRLAKYFGYARALDELADRLRFALCACDRLAEECSRQNSTAGAANSVGVGSPKAQRRGGALATRESLAVGCST